MTYRRHLIVAKVSMLAVLLAACVEDSASSSSGTSGGTPDASTGVDAATADASTVDTGTTDAAPPTDANSDASGLACDPAKAFGTPVPVAELNSSDSQFGARITPSGLQLYLTRRPVAATQEFEVRRYTRRTLQSTWEIQTAEADLQYKFVVGNVAYSDSGYLTFESETSAYLSMLRQNVGTTSVFEIFSTKRATVNDSWGTPTQVGVFLSLGNSDRAPFLDTRNNAIYFARLVGLQNKLFRSIRSAGVFAAPAAVTITPDPTSASSPVLSPDGNTLYFSSKIATKNVIYKATRTGQAFTSAMEEPNLNIPGRDNELNWFSADSCEAYLTINSQIHRAIKPK
jgi:hypothetical protein